MRLGIVSDTHGHVENTRQAIRLLDSLDVDQVLHCGDIGTEEIVPMFSAWPTHFVFGNCDYDQAGLAKVIEKAGQHCHGLFGDLEFEGVRFALLHSHERRRFQEALDNPEYQFVCYGHTHLVDDRCIDGKHILNPGALYRAPKHSLAIVDLPSGEVNIVEL
ncbi:metallophosphoesterase family protein [Aeoliella mucimassa]|uniref:Phosphoesterase n=1 Tax=Aeoliella mucimassa TaxID=2527972 RepID=A0A518AV02_9BACT|nr:YfcE family phosphodiesterase [Aeoliella mucimassa]QDU58555.1 hypothetical protein Pan181_47940 [Aeoliella mucimassa]